MSPSRARLFANVLGYQLAWFAAVGSAAAGQVWLGCSAALAFAVATLCLGGRWRADVFTLLVALPLGFGMDSLFAAMGWLAYTPEGPWPAVAPPWIAAIWLAFAMTLNHSLRFLRGHPAGCALLAFVAAPLAYWSASRGFGVLEFAAPAPVVLLAVGLGWALLLPGILALDTRLPRRLEWA